MSKILTIGEPMALFVADQEGTLEEVEHFSRFVAGAEVNFSIGMARLGHEVTYVTQLGDDPFGRQIEQFLAQNKINTSFITYDKNYFTGMQWKQKVCKGDPMVFSLRRNSAASHIDQQVIRNLCWDSFDHIHLTGIFPALSHDCCEVVKKLMLQARTNGVQISYDPNLRPGLWSSRETMVHTINDLAGYADLVFPGIKEGKLLTGRDDVQKIADFYHEVGVKIVIIKLGAEGAYTSTEGEHFYTSGCHVDKVVDTVGAGDGFAVGVVSGLLEGLELKDAVKRGTAIGALAVMSPGDNDGFPDRRGLDAFMAKQRS